MHNISSCDENRLKIAQEADEALTLGRALFSEGKFAKALEKYLIAFDNGRYVSGWGGVRLSYIPSEIAQMGAKYPPALAALRERRDARETLILRGKVDYDVIAEWISLNRYLGDHGRMLKMLKEVDDDLRKKIIDENFDELLSDKQYKLAAEVLDDKGNMFFNWECMYEAEKYFPRKVDNPRWNHEKMLEYDRKVVRREGLKLFELALAVKRTDSAQEVARRVLIHCPEASTYSALIKVAVSVGSKSTAKQLLKKAKTELSPEDFMHVQNEDFRS